MKNKERHYNKLNNKTDNLTNQQQEKAISEQTFYPRLPNMTNIQLTEKEKNLLNKGSKYNMGTSPKINIKQPVYETENAVRHVKDVNQQEAIRYLSTKKNIQQLASK